MSRDAAGEPIADPDYHKRMNYHIHIFIDGLVDTYGAQTAAGVRWFLKSVTFGAECVSGRSVKAQVWDTRQELWCYGDCKPIPEGREVVFALEPTAHAGSLNL